MVQAAGYGATFVSALSCTITSCVCYAFVDNMDLVHARPRDNHPGSDLIPERKATAFAPQAKPSYNPPKGIGT